MTDADERALLERIRAHCRKQRWFAGDDAPEYRVAFYGADGRAHLDDDLTYAATHSAQHPQACVYCEQEPSDLATLAAWPEDVYAKLDVVSGCVYRVRLGVFPPEPTWAAAIAGGTTWTALSKQLRPS